MFISVNSSLYLKTLKLEMQELIRNYCKSYFLFEKYYIWQEAFYLMQLKCVYSICILQKYVRGCKSREINVTTKVLFRPRPELNAHLGKYIELPLHSCPFPWYSPIEFPFAVTIYALDQCSLLISKQIRKWRY